MSFWKALLLLLNDDADSEGPSTDIDGDDDELVELREICAQLKLECNYVRSLLHQRDEKLNEANDCVLGFVEERDDIQIKLNEANDRLLGFW